MFCQEVISVGDSLYVVLRIIRITANPIIDTWKHHLKCDKVFKKEPYYYFCEKIIDVEPIE
jgi:hypothetical protein